MNIKNILVILLSLCCTIAWADYSIDWYTIDTGGGRSIGGPYVLTGTIGQNDAGYHYEAPYELLGGSWVGGPLCIVNFYDFARFADLWLAADPSADLDGDNDIDFGDLGSLGDFWLSYCPYEWPLR